MKTGLFFDCGRNFIILPHKSVLSLLNTSASATGNFMNSPALFANILQNFCLAFKVVLSKPNCKPVDLNVLYVVNLQSALAHLVPHHNFCLVFISNSAIIHDLWKCLKRSKTFL